MLENMELEKLIKPCDLIETQHENNNDRVITVVLSSFGSFIEVKQVDDYLSSVLMIGDKLNCRFVTKKFIYLFEAEVYNIKFASRSVVLKAISINIIENKRKHNRYDVYLSASFCRNETPGECYCVVVNVSLEGLSIITRNSLVLGEKINLSIYFSSSYFLMVECSVQWLNNINQNNLYGLMIVNIDEISKFHYSNFLKKLRRKEKILMKKGEKLL